MLLLKAYFHFAALLKMGAYRLAYGRRVRFGRGFTFRRSLALAIEPQGSVVIGDGCFFNNGCSISSHCSVSVGSDTVFGEHVCIYDHDHAYRDLSRPAGAQGYTHAPVSIGKGCWLGTNVVVLKGAVIGDHVVVGAGCVVRGVIPPNTLVTADGNQRPITSAE